MPVSLKADPVAAAALMRGRPGLTNVGGNADLLNPAAAYGPGHAPSAWQMETDSRLADDAATAYGDSPAIQALHQMADARRLEGSRTMEAADADQASNGLRRAMTGATIENQVGDVLSEGAARRDTLPYAEARTSRNAASTQALAALTHLAPAQATARGAVEAAQAHAQGGMAVENIRTHALMGLVEAMIKGRGTVDPDELKAIIQTLTQAQAGGGQPPP